MYYYINVVSRVCMFLLHLKILLAAGTVVGTYAQTFMTIPCESMQYMSV